MLLTHGDSVILRLPDEGSRRNLKLCAADNARVERWL